MTMGDFVLSCLHLDGKIYDKYEDAFGVDTGEEDIIDALDNSGDCYKGFGCAILLNMWYKVIERYSGVLDEEKFYCDVSSPYEPHFYYNGVEVESSEDIERFINEEEEEEQ